MTRLADQDARDRIRDDLDTTLVVEAAAGTGKTTELVTRMVALLTAGRARLDRMVAVTFTDAAAGELKLRLRNAIEDARRARPGEALDEALRQLEEARIGTIHSFCADLLRERPVEAGVDPLFAIAPRDVAEGLLDRAFDRWFEAKLQEPGEAMRRLLRRRGGEGPHRLLRGAARELVERRDFPAPWRHAGGFGRDATIDALLAEMAALAAFVPAGNPDDYFVKSLAEIGRFVEEVRRREAIRGRDHDGLEAELLALAREKHWRWTGFRRAAGSFPKSELLERRDRLRAALDDFLRRAGADLAPKLRDELQPVVEGYEALKRRAGCLDFLDLLLRARDLVRGNAAVRAELQRRYTHIFVDEFQDTDPLQVEILLLLAADDPEEGDWRRVRPVAGKLFLVGDPKQSIYRFRRADVALYERVKRQLVAAGAALVDLSVSFRAVPDIQEAVNAAFARRMQDGVPRYVPLSPYRPGVETQPAVVALPVPAPYGDYGTIVDWRIDESLPDAIAAFVKWLVEESKWTVTERDRPGERVPVRPRHVCLLFRRFRTYLTDVTRPYVRALEARHLPHLLVGGTSFHVREEVEAIRNALAAIERPEDELAVFATLRGPFVALGDGALLAFRERYRTLHPFFDVPADAPPALREVADALGVLRALHRRRNRRPIADTIGRLLGATRAHAGLATWPTGEQALANVTRLMDLARRAERTGVTSFRAFVEWLTEQAEHGEAGDAPIVEEGTEGVRMMTVHGAKGLEFPVVVLADLTCKETPGDPQRWVDADRGLCVLRLAGSTPPELAEHADEEMARERDEATRVLYVAATRARDLLVVPALGDGHHEGGWLAALGPVIYPSPERVHRPEMREPPGCPAFGTDTTPGRPPNVARPPDAVVPGLHVPEVGRHRVVWWDPATLVLDVQESAGLAQQKILAVDERGVRAEEGVRAHAAWQAERARVRAVGETPSLRVVTATEEAARGGRPAADVVVESVPLAEPRPHGRRFGTLVHAVLAAVDLDADRAAVADATALEARLLGASAEETEAAVETVVRALAHPLMRRAAVAARAGRCRRECPIGLLVDGGAVLEGIVDVAFAEDGAWTAVDFKTDVEIAGRLEEYRRQVDLYAQAITAATGVAARGVLLRV